MTRGILLLLVFCCSWVAKAQTSGDTDFDSISKRASSALSSNPAAAATLYRQGVQMRPDWTEGWFYLGASLFQTGQFADSKQAFLRTAALAPNRGTVWGFLGLVENQLGETERALADMRKGEALGLADDEKFIAAVRNTAALICIQKNDFSGAVAQLRVLAKMGAESEMTIDEMGVSVLGLPMLTTKTEPKRALIRDAGQAACAFYAQRTDEAGIRLQKLVSEYPNDPGVHYLYGIYLLGRDKDAARAEFGKELHLAPTRATARLQLAMLDIQAGKPQEADQLAREASKIDGKEPLAFLIIGRAMLDEKRFMDALPPLSTAIRLSPENAEGHLYLEQAYRHLGKLDEARREHSEFERRKAENDPTQYNVEPTPKAQ